MGSSGGVAVGGSTRCPASGGTRRSRCARTSGGAGGSPCSTSGGTRRSCCRSATVLDTHYVSRPAFSAFRIDVYHKLIRAGGGVHDEAVSCVRIEGYEYHYILRDIIYDAYLCGTIWDYIEASAIIIYPEGVCGSRKGISAVAGLGHVLKRLLRTLAGTTLARDACRGSRSARTGGGAPRSRCRTCRGARASGGARRSRDRTCARAGSSLAVSLGLVVTVYGLDFVEAIPTIYEINPVGVAREDKVVAGTGEYVVVAFAGEDYIVAAATSDCVVPAATPEEVVPVAAEERIVAVGADQDLRQGFVPGEECSDHH